MKIKKGDQVLIISGKDKGKKGKVVEAQPKKGKIIVEEINLLKKSVRPKKSGEKGQLVKIASPFPVSRVKIICTKCGKAVRVGYKIEGDKKFRICKKCKQEI
jgi:large subunit ribosomal protein L24